MVVGWLARVRRPRRRLAGLVPMLTLGLLVCWPYTEAGRFLVPLLPFLLIGAFEGLLGLARWGAHVRRNQCVGQADRTKPRPWSS